jgi:acetyl esterase/lipase
MARFTRLTVAGLLSVLAGVLCVACGNNIRSPMTLKQYMAQTGPEPAARIAYGDAPSQYAELFEPPGEGPFPVVFLVHGGCWLEEFGGIRQFRGMAQALADHGVAVWNVEYRRVDEAGGGYPGTFEDIISAFDALRANAAAYRLDVGHVVGVGHSAGGFMVLWAAGRGRLPASSPLYRPHPLPVAQVVGLGALANLREWTDLCGFDVAKLTGVASAARPDVYADTSPAELLPNGSHMVFLNGAIDRQVPAEVATRFAAKALAAGDHAETIVLPGVNHFDESSTTSLSWATVLPLILKAAGRSPP